MGTNPFFEDIVRETGLSLEPMGTVEDFLKVLEHPDLWHPQKGVSLMHEMVFRLVFEPQVEIIERLGRADDTVVIGGTFAVGAWMAAEKQGLPFVRLQLQPSILFGPHDPPVMPNGKKLRGPLWWRRLFLWLIENTVIRATLGRSIKRARRNMGLPPWKRRAMDCYADADLNLCTFPPWFAPVTPDWPDNVRHTGFLAAASADVEPLDGALAAFMDQEPAPIVFTPGPAGPKYGREFFAVCADACQRLGQRGVFVTRDTKLDLELPATIRAVKYAPFSQLFPRASVVVHHGGIGTMAQGFASGRPQLVVPFAFDQPDNAVRLRDMGVGDALPWKGISAAALAERIDRVQQSAAIQETCRRVRDQALEPSTPPVEVACDLIEELRREQVT